MSGPGDLDIRPLRRDAAENRERLLSAAARVFAREGLSAPVEEIARVAGVGMGTLYRRFPTKEALIEELVRQQLTDVIEAGRRARTLPPGQGLEAFLWQAGAVQAAASGCLSRLWTEAGTASLVAEARRLIGGLVADGQRAGRIRPDVGVADISLLLWGLNGIIATTQVVAPQAWRRALELSIAGLRSFGDQLRHDPLTPSELDAISHHPR